MPDLVQAMVTGQPAVLLLALDFPGLGGPAGVREVRRLSPATKIIVLAPNVDAVEELEVLRAGARGYCGPLETDVLLKMIDKVHQGELWAGRKTIGALFDEFFGDGDLAPRDQAFSQTELERLTHREREILRLLGEGASNKEIANTLNVAVSTIKAHLTKIFRKLGQSDRVRLALYAAGTPRLQLIYGERYPDNSGGSGHH